MQLMMRRRPSAERMQMASRKKEQCSARPCMAQLGTGSCARWLCIRCLPSHDASIYLHWVLRADQADS